MSRVGRISVGIIETELKAAKARECIGAHQTQFRRKPAQGHHVGSGLHGYESSQGCVLWGWCPLHTPNPLSMLQEIWVTYCFCSSCTSLKFFLECPFQSQVPFLVQQPRQRSLAQPFCLCCELNLGFPLLNWPTWSARVALADCYKLRTSYCFSFGPSP